MSDIGKQSVAGISAAAPFVEVARRASSQRFKTEHWTDVDCQADVIMDNVEWGDEPTDGLFNRPVLYMSGRIAAIHATDSEFFDGVQNIEFPVSEMAIIEESDEKSEMVDDVKFNREDGSFAYDETMIPRVDFCYRFTYNELALLAVRGAVVEVPELPERVTNNKYMGMPMTCDIIRLTDVESGETIWVVDAPGENYKKEHGYEIETGSLDCGYQLATEIPEVAQMKKFGDYIDLPGVQLTTPYEDYSDDLEDGDFDLSNALFQDFEEPAPIVGQDVKSDEHKIEPLVMPEYQEEIDMDREMVNGLVEDAFGKQGLPLQNAPKKLDEIELENISEEASFADMVANMQETISESEDTVSDELDFDDESYEDSQDIIEATALFDEALSADEAAQQKKQQKMARQHQIEEEIKKEEIVDMAREKANIDNVDFSQMSEDELSQALFGE